jgi:hypothetical protein
MVALGGLSGWRASAADQVRVEVVFCLDTTGSMGGLIEGAKQKIWSIANQIVVGTPTPELSIGLVGYRDYGDAYITEVYPLNDDLDQVFQDLMSFTADGGGDTPEHVNRALHDALHGISWSDDEETLKIVFLVGDCPPHMDYDDGYDYRDVCLEAVSHDIIINTVQCGEYPETLPFWKDIATRGEGKYAAVAQEGGMNFIETPFDDELARLNGLLEETVIPFGTASRRGEYEEKREKVKTMAPSVAAERATYKSADSDMGSYDLIDALDGGSVDLEALKDRELPEELRGMSMIEKRRYIARIQGERDDLLEEITLVSGKRAAYIEESLSLDESASQDSFDRVVLQFIEEQAASKGIRY